jgi:hypothetical protein
MQSIRQPVSQCPDQTTLLDRVANRPIFPGTSHVSACMSRNSALADICPAMYNVPFCSMVCKLQFKSHAEINSFILIFQYFSEKNEISTRKGHN